MGLDVEERERDNPGVAEAIKSTVQGVRERERIEAALSDPRASQEAVQRAVEDLANLNESGETHWGHGDRRSGNKVKVRRIV